MSIWERFESIADVEKINEVKHTFAPVKEGVYKTMLEVISPAESKNGLPMIKGKFRMTDNNRILFYNQVLQNLNYPDLTQRNIAEAVNFIGGLLGEDYTFTSLVDMANTLESIPVGSEHYIRVTYGNRDLDRKFPVLAVTTKEDFDISNFKLNENVNGDTEF